MRTKRQPRVQVAPSRTWAFRLNGKDRQKMPEGMGNLQGGVLAPGPKLTPIPHLQDRISP